MDSKAFTGKFSELGFRYLTENMRVWQRYAETARRLSEGQIDGDSLKRQLGEFARKDGEEFLQNLMTLSLNYYSLLLDLSVDLTNRVFDQVLNRPAASEPAPSAPRAPARSSSGTRFELVFEGQPGQIVSNPFVVHNKKGAATEVSFEITEFIAEDNTKRFRAPVEFVPDRFELVPGAEQVVQSRLQINPEFEPGRRYMALVRVTNFPGMEIGLVVVPVAGTVEGASPTRESQPSGDIAAGESSLSSVPTLKRRERAKRKPAGKRTPVSPARKRRSSRSPASRHEKK